jgi:hypothetical protein
VKERICRCKLGPSIEPNRVENINMAAKNDPSAHALFQEALLDDTAELGIVMARFEGFDRRFFDDLQKSLEIPSKKDRFRTLARRLRGTPR